MKSKKVDENGCWILNLGFEPEESYIIGKLIVILCFKELQELYHCKQKNPSISAIKVGTLIIQFKIFTKQNVARIKN
jgi:hypothetical protein